MLNQKTIEIVKSTVPVLKEHGQKLSTKQCLQITQK